MKRAADFLKDALLAVAIGFVLAMALTSWVVQE